MDRLDVIQNTLNNAIQRIAQLEARAEEDQEMFHSILTRESINDIKQILRDGDDALLLTEEQLFAMEGWDNPEHEIGLIDPRIRKAQEYDGKTWSGLGKLIRRRQAQQRAAREAAQLAPSK
jgi:hypothetical protein